MWFKRKRAPPRGWVGQGVLVMFFLVESDEAGWFEVYSCC